jgi:hypothetical protein
MGTSTHAVAERHEGRARLSEAGSVEHVSRLLPAGLPRQRAASFLVAAAVAGDLPTLSRPHSAGEPPCARTSLDPSRSRTLTPAVLAGRRGVLVPRSQPARPGDRLTESDYVSHIWMIENFDAGAR